MLSGGIAAGLTLWLAAGAAPADGWPQYRGPGRNGVSKETGLLKAWPEGGPKALWRASLGDGYSGIAVAGGRACTMYSRGEDELVACFDARTGKELWKLRTDANRTDEMGAGPRSTPTIDGDLLFALGAKGMLYALKAATGEQVWSKDLKEEYGARVPRWGVATEPLVEGNLLVIDAGGRPGASLVALDKATGRTAWTAHDDKPGYSAPIAVTIHDVRQIVSFSASSLVGVAAADGRVLWSLPWETSYDVNAAAPVFVPPDLVFVSSGYDKGAGVYRLTKTAGGAWQAEEVWKSRVMKNHFNSSVLLGSHLYGFDNATLKCIDAHTGEEKWEQRGFAKGSLLVADGHLVIFSESGLLALAEASPDAYVEKARAQILEGRTWTMPSLAGGTLFLRNQAEMVALDVSG
jgi:outer membrane protein assembly factor BamB